MIDVKIAVINPANLPLISKKPLITAASCGKVISLAKLSEIGILGIWFMLLQEDIAHIKGLFPIRKAYVAIEKPRKEPIVTILSNKRFLCVFLRSTP